ALRLARLGCALKMTKPKHCFK
ncbi:putative membrane protein, partial [Vibrio parahaemolyticus V-223/04]